MAEACPIVILAAGASTRLGRPKQLLPWRGKTLLRHAVDAALETGSGRVYVVLGAYGERIIPELNGLPVRVISNPQWQEGMASSIRCGLQHLMQSPVPPQAVIFMVCDQPALGAAHLLNLVQKSLEVPEPVIASHYAGKAGTPALFKQSFFHQLLALKGDKGAGKLFENHPRSVCTIPFPSGSMDIDTEEDLQYEGI